MNTAAFVKVDNVSRRCGLENGTLALQEDKVYFVNLELIDTNLADHRSIDLKKQFQTIFHLQTDTFREKIA